MNRNAGPLLVVGAIVLAIFVLVPLLWGGLAGWSGGGWGMMGPGMMGGFGWMWLMPFGGVLLLVLIVWGIVALAQGASTAGDTGGRESAVDILKRRYARGEIDRAEYEAKRRDLE